MRVLVTGSSGCLARVLLPALCADARIERVTGIDMAPPRFAHAKFRALALDIAARLDATHLAGHHALIHMAYVVLRGRMRAARMRAINVDASLRVFELAAAQGIERLVLLSSAAVYGSGNDIAESAPLAPLAGFRYASHKAALETLIAARFPQCLRLRPHVILGAHAQPLLRCLLGLPFYLALAGDEPRLQCVHELDVVAAIMAALHSTLSGSLNLAAADRFAYGEVIRRHHARAYALPVGIAQAALSAVWSISGWGGEPAWIKALAKPLTLDCTRAARELGWAPRHSAAEALSAALH